jgi:DNA repair protein RadC
VKLAGRPQARVPAEAAAMLTQHTGEVDREVFVIVLDHVILDEAGRFVSLRERGVL